MISEYPFNKFGQNHVGLKHHKSAIQPMIKIDTFPEIISFCECQITPHQYHDNLTFQISQLQYPNSSSKIKTFLNMKFKNLHTSKYQQTRGKVAQFRTKAGFLATLLSMCASYIEETDRLKNDRYEQHAHHSTTKVRLVTPFDRCTLLIFMMFCAPGKWRRWSKFAAQNVACDQKQV